MPDANPIRPWVVAGSAAARTALAPLLEARRVRQPVVEFDEDDLDVLRTEPELRVPAGAEAVLMVGPKRISPRQGLPSLFLSDADGRQVPVGWLPDVGSLLATYAQAAKRVLARRRLGGPAIVMGQWEDRYLRVGLRTSRWFDRHESPWPAFQWTADRISREDLLRGLAGCGPAIAFYFGHGRPRGWAGYHGVRRDHFGRQWPKPMGALVALCCENASRWRTDMSFAETLALRGVFAGALAAVTKTEQRHNRRLGPEFCEVLTSTSVRTLGELVLALPREYWRKSPYRFIGDPAAPLAGARDAARRAAAVYAPAPDEALLPWEAISA